MKRHELTNWEAVEILVAEDSLTQAEQLRYLLERHGCRVTVAANGKLALAAARSKRPTLILTDIMMPEMDGYTFCKLIKEDSTLADIPVILLTELASPEDVVRGLECGADNFIRKPYDEKYLLQRIDYLLSNLQFRQTERLSMGIEVNLKGNRYFITAERKQILDLLISVYEDSTQLMAGLKRSLQTLDALHYIAQGLSESTTEQEVLDITAQRVTRVPDVGAAWIFLRESGDSIRVAASHALPVAIQPVDALGGDCICKRMLIDGEMDAVTNIIECERLKSAEFAECGMRFHASVPIVGSNALLGVLNLAGLSEDTFTDADLEVLHGVGHQVGLALERARLREHLERLVEERTESLKESEAWFRGVFESQDDAVLVLTPDGAIFNANAATERVFGYEASECIGRSVELLHADHEHALEFDRQVQAAFANGTSARFEFELKRSNGEVFPTEHTVSLLKSPEGTSLGIVSVIRDLTNRNKAAADLKKMEEQFHQAQRMESIGVLAGGIAHDMNNILSAINGFAELAMADLAEDSALYEDLHSILEAGNRGTSLVRQILAFSRRQVLEPTVLDINAVVVNFHKMIERLIGDDIEILMLLDDSLKPVLADSTQLEQVLMNLAVNARDAMPDGGTLTIKTQNVYLDDQYQARHYQVEPGDYVLLSVSDTGHGMDQETQSRLFEPFFTTKELGHGTGLGLATVYGIIKQHNGYIWVYSEPGHGTDFNIYLPPTLETSVEPPKTALQQTLPKGCETVLVVDDDASVRTVIGRALEKNGYRVIGFEHPNEVLKYVAMYDGALDLVLTDMVMPGMNGPDLVQELLVMRPELRTIYASGYSHEAIRTQGAIDGDAVYLAKPFTLHSLLKEVRRALDGE